MSTKTILIIAAIALVTLSQLALYTARDISNAVAGPVGAVGLGSALIALFFLI